LPENSIGCFCEIALFLILLFFRFALRFWHIESCHRINAPRHPQVQTGRNYLLGQRFWRASARRFRRRSRSAFEYRLGTPRASFANALAAPLLIAGILNG
jgi:hypothetical protein